MDYQDSFPSAPVRYAFDDEDSDDEGVVPLPPVQVESTATLTPQHTTLIVGLSGPGSVLLRSLKGNLPTLGHIEANCLPLPLALSSPPNHSQHSLLTIPQAFLKHWEALLKALVPYEAPNMVKGLSAALLSHCEIHAIPCYSLLTLQESMLGKLLVTQDTLDGYHEGLTALGLRLDYDEQALSRVLSSDTKSRVDEHHHRLYL
ncbi:hypothetical protein BDF14DRAFT_1741513 [Spinellus fusiger]|nr:hypothetical protein BDF14DRAFT_1741513 [Spinellus fusiger]